MSNLISIHGNAAANHDDSNVMNIQFNSYQGTMKKYEIVFAMILMLVLCSSCKGQVKRDASKDHTISETKEMNIETNEVMVSNAPDGIVRMIKQDRNGNIWFAAFDGIFRYNGKSFVNTSSEVSSARFFSALEDNQGNMWFGSIGSGVYRYDGFSIQNITTDDGLVNSEIVCIYEDKNGHLWFGANGGVSQYDGDIFRNYKMKGDTIIADKSGIPLPNLKRPSNEVNSIIEDRTGKHWFATRGYTFIYDGNSFTKVTHEGMPFMNIRWVIEDQKGDIWLGGNSGLWRFNGSTFAHIMKNFVGYIYEDKNGNIWTSSEASVGGGWALSRYDQKSLSEEKPTATIVKSGEGMIFGILEADDGRIWFGTLNGVHRYDGKTVTHFKNIVDQD